MGKTLLQKEIANNVLEEGTNRDHEENHRSMKSRKKLCQDADL